MSEGRIKMPYDDRMDALSEMEEGLPSSPPQANNSPLPERHAATPGKNPLLNKISIREFQPDEKLQSEIDASLGEWPPQNNLG
jgi:hypothetical protein